MTDFTLTTYRRLLLALQAADYNFYTFEDWCEGRAVGKYVILRHDVDLKPENSLEIAKIEFELGLKSTFYFRLSENIFKPEIIKNISNFGHEIGYHYRDFVDANGNESNAFNSFKANLKKIRSIVRVKTISMDGCPASKYDNRDLWKNINYRDLGIIGEPYFDFLTKENLERGVLYFTDTARMWDGDKYNVRDRVVGSKKLVVGSRELVVGSEKLIVDSGEFVDGSVKQLPTIHSTFDFIKWLETEKPSNSMMITTHPQRWTDNKLGWWKELIMQSIKNEVKRGMISIK